MPYSNCITWIIIFIFRSRVVFNNIFIFRKSICTTDLVENEYKIILCSDKTAAVYLILSIICFATSILVFVQMSMFISKTRSAKAVYDRELKSILSNYHSFIQKVDSFFDLSDYKLVSIDTFTDMLEIRDTINQPISLKVGDNIKSN